MNATRTNVILFPRANVAVVALIEYWFAQGYTIGNTRKNNLCLMRPVYE